MHNIKDIRKNFDEFVNSIKKRNQDLKLENILELDKKNRNLIQNKETLEKGEKVYRGQEIGGVGNTGRSTAAHLHYEVKRNNKTLDPRSEFYTYNYKLEDLIYYR